MIRPERFLQKALSEVSSKLFKEEFKFRLVVLSTVEELHEYIDPTQLTFELGGTLQYSHHDWIQQRIVRFPFIHNIRYFLIIIFLLVTREIFRDNKRCVHFVR